jgi:hypothetical protein
LPLLNDYSVPHLTKIEHSDSALNQMTAPFAVTSPAAQGKDSPVPSKESPLAAASVGEPAHGTTAKPAAAKSR